MAVDLDPQSVSAARAVLTRFAPQGPWEVREQSVFALDPSQIGVFDVVYAWGSLHHTGALYESWRRAALLVALRGILIVAVYRKTYLCGLWRLEKWLYSRSPKWCQWCARTLFVGAIRLACLLTGRDFRAYRESYGESYRGMDYYHDVHDWLGGYPYESISPPEADDLCRSIGFVPVRSFVKKGMRLGLIEAAATMNTSGVVRRDACSYSLHRPNKMTSGKKIWGKKIKGRNSWKSIFLPRVFSPHDLVIIRSAGLRNDTILILARWLVRLRAEARVRVRCAWSASWRRSRTPGRGRETIAGMAI